MSLSLKLGAKNMNELIIVVPAFNEERSVGSVLTDLTSVLVTVNLRTNIELF